MLINKMKNNKKGQIASMDLILSAVILLFFISIIMIILIKISNDKDENIIYGGEIFTNIEKIENQNINFLTNFKIDEAKLNEFSNKNYEDMKKLIFFGSDNYNEYTNEFCMFSDKYTSSGYQVIPFLDGDNQFGHTDCSYNNPCKGYDVSIPFAKPVLINNEIVTMYIVICE
jgi:hypothetical protein